MAPLITHLVIGERVFALVQLADPSCLAYGSFLLGCILVDAHSFLEGFDRRQMHFAGRPEEDGQAALHGCERFLDRLDALLVHPWGDLAETEQAFVAGYVCHLTADEFWKESGWALLQEHQVSSWSDFPVPGEVMLTAFDVLSSRLFVGFAAVAAALAGASVPDVLTHVPREMFEETWSLAREYVLDGGTSESYFHLLERLGRSPAEIEETRQQHVQHWDEALSLIHGTDGVAQYVEKAVAQSVQRVLELWNR